jgi:hypothetical protein
MVDPAPTTDGTEMTINNYKTYYSNTNWAALHVNAQHVLKQFDTDADGGGKTGDQLYDEVKVTSNEMPHAYAMLLKDSRRITILHRAMHFTAPHGWDPRAMDGQGHHVHGRRHQKPASSSCRSSASHTCSSRCSNSLLQPRAHAAGVRERRRPAGFRVHHLRRGSQYVQRPLDSLGHIPPSRVHECVPKRAAHTPARPNQGKQSLPNIGSHVTYRGVIDWLRVACMEDGKVAIQRGQNPTVPLLDDELVAKLLRMAKNDLPAWTRTDTPPPTLPALGAPGPPIEIWERMFERVLDSHVPPTPATDPDRVKKPSEAWKGTISILLRLCQVSSEDKLPQLWHDWANCKKELRHTVLQEQLRRMARSLKMPNALYTLAFAGSYEGNLEQGLQPFITTYLGEQSLAEQQALNKISDLLREGAPRLDDILDLKAAGKLLIPTRESQMNRMMRAFSVVLAVTVGIHNPCYRAYHMEILNKYEHVQPKLETLADTYPPEPVYAQVLRWIQLRFHEYWIELELTLEDVSAPAFHTLYESIRYRQWTWPQIPATYLATPTKKRPAPGKPDGAGPRGRHSKGEDSGRRHLRSQRKESAGTSRKGGSGWQDYDLLKISRHRRKVGKNSKHRRWKGSLPFLALERRLLQQLPAA